MARLTASRRFGTMPAEIVSGILEVPLGSFQSPDGGANFGVTFSAPLSSIGLRLGRSCRGLGSLGASQRGARKCHQPQQYY